MIRISLTLVGVLVGVLLAGLTWLAPSPDAAAVEKRAAVCEALAVRCATAPADAPAHARAVLARHPEIVSVGVRDAAGGLVAEAGGHDAHWTGHDPGKSTPTHVAVPLERAGAAVGRVEVVFRPLPYSQWWWRLVGGPYFPALAFTWVAGTAATALFLRKVFHRINPNDLKSVSTEVRDAVNTLVEGVLVLDRHGAVALANDGFARLVGQAPGELEGREASALGWVGADAPWAQTLRDGEARRGVILTLGDGERGRTVSVNVTPVRQHDRVVGVLVTVDDLTPAQARNARLKRAMTRLKRSRDVVRAQKRQLGKAKAAAEAASRAKGEFLANVSHEIRTPMNAILGMTELVLEGRLAAEQRDCLEVVEESAGALLGVINDLLDLSKIEAGRFALDPVPFDLRDVLDDTLDALALRAHKKGLELVLDVSPAVPAVVVGDPTRVRQVVVNLVGNAVKFTDRGEVVVRVRVDHQGAGEVRFRVSVADTGPGVPADRLRAIFEPFVQADGGTARRHGGTGLGLSISTHLAELMGGRVWADSEVGVGSVFHFTAAAGVPDAGPPAAPDVGRADHRPALVVDANPTARQALAGQLAGLSLRPTATDPAAAVAELERAAAVGLPYPLAFVDAAGDPAAGFALAAEARGRDLVETVIVLLSAADLPRDADRARRAGATGYLRKPVKRADLIAAVRGAFDPMAATTPAPVLTPRPVGPLASGPPLSVLVVDDNVFNQKVAAMKLGRWGHRVRVAGSGAEALAALADERFDLILTDVQMPDMDGFELTAAVRRLEAGDGRVPVVALTADAMAGTRERCLAAGMDDYVSKPIRDDDLLAAIARVVPAHAAGVPERHGRPADRPAADGSVSGVVDGAAALDRAGGSQDALGELVEVFYQDCDAQLVELAAGIRTGDAARVRAAAHTIKGMAGFFGAGPAVGLAARLEQAGQSADLSDAAELFADLSRELDAVRAALGEFSPATPAPVGRLIGSAR